MITLAIVVGLILVACLFLVCIGCRAILTLCGQLERDRRNGYRIEPPRSRPCPRWMRSETRRATR